MTSTKKCFDILVREIIMSVVNIKYSLLIGYFLLLIYMDELLYSHNLNSLFLFVLFSKALYFVNLKEFDFHLSIIFLIVFYFSLNIYLLSLYIFSKATLNSFLL